MTKTPEQMAKEYIEQKQLEYDEAGGAYYGFLAGYQAGRLNSEGVQAAKPQWISVKDRLPEYDQFVLLWHPDCKRQFVGFRVDSGIMDPLFWWHLELDMHEPERIITHWMPLPEAPKDK